MNYALRLQAHDGYRDMFSTVFNDRFTRILCLPHAGRAGNNPHYHFVFTCDYKAPALRMYLKKYFTQGKGNRHLSLKTWDGDTKACSYMFHEGTEPILRTGFSDTELENFKALNEGIKRAIKKNAPAQIVADATEHFKGKDPDHQLLFKWIMLRLRANGDWLPNKYQMDRWIMRIQANLKDDVQYGSYLKRLYESWYGEYSWTSA